MIISELKLRNIIRNLLKEGRGTPSIEVDNKKAFAVYEEISGLGEKIQVRKIEDAIDFLQKILNIFEAKISPNISNSDKPLILSATWCGICPDYYNTITNKEDISAYVYICGPDPVPEILFDYKTYLDLHKNFAAGWNKNFTWDKNYPGNDYLLPEPKKMEGFYTNDAGETTRDEFYDFKSDDFPGNNWLTLIQLCTMNKYKMTHEIKAPITMNKEVITGYWSGYPTTCTSYDIFIKSIKEAIINLKKITTKNTSNPSLREIKTKISRNLNQIYNHNKNYEDFFDMLKKLAAQYSGNNNVENIIEIFEKTLLNSSIKNNAKSMEEKFYSINSYVFQHRDKSECKDWIKFISWVVKRYKLM